MFDFNLQILHSRNKKLKAGYFFHMKVEISMKKIGGVKVV